MGSEHVVSWVLSGRVRYSRWSVEVDERLSKRVYGIFRIGVS